MIGIQRNKKELCLRLQFFWESKKIKLNKNLILIQKRYKFIT